MSTVTAAEAAVAPTVPRRRRTERGARLRRATAANNAGQSVDTMASPDSLASATVVRAVPDTSNEKQLSKRAMSDVVDKIWAGMCLVYANAVNDPVPIDIAEADRLRLCGIADAFVEVSKRFRRVDLRSSFIPQSEQDAAAREHRQPVASGLGRAKLYADAVQLGIATRALYDKVSQVVRRTDQWRNNAETRIASGVGSSVSSVVPPETKAQIISQLTQLCNGFPAVTYNKATRTLVVTTEDILIRGVDFGPFNLEFKFDDLPYYLSAQHAVACRVVAVRPNKLTSAPHITHPHVKDSIMCEGEARGKLMDLLKKGLIFEACVVMQQVLRTYNSGSPHAPIDRWIEQREHNRHVALLQRQMTARALSRARANGATVGELRMPIAANITLPAGVVVRSTTSHVSASGGYGFLDEAPAPDPDAAPAPAGPVPLPAEAVSVEEAQQPLLRLNETIQLHLFRCVACQRYREVPAGTSVCPVCSPPAVSTTIAASVENMNEPQIQGAQAAPAATAPASAT